MRLRRVALALLGILLLGVVFVLQLPTERSCQASGRTVDPTHRHCLDVNGYVQLREHIVGHALEPVICLPVVMLVVLALYVAWRRDQRP